MDPDPAIVPGDDPPFVIVTGGAPPHAGVLEHLPGDRFVIAADSGLDHARALGLAVDLVVGDLDSISPAGLARAEGAGVPIERHPVDKDEIDLDLAIDAALERGARRLVVLGGGGDRLDHVLAGLLLLGQARLATLEDVTVWFGPARLVALHGPARTVVDGPRGSYVSLLPLQGPACGVTTTGLRFPLHGDTLPAGTSRGVSNQLAEPPAIVALDAGVLLVIQPHALEGVP
jgi:thiamine pyrophosphokinase